MKVIDPTDLLQDAADVVGELWENVVVIGAAALQAILADDIGGEAGDVVGEEVVIVAATRDVDLALETRAVDEIVQKLEDAKMAPSDVEGERGFTWVRDDLRIQLVRSFDPFPRGRAAGLPENPQLSLLREAQHRFPIAFAAAPAESRLQAATSAAFVALKQLAFGRKRFDDNPVERDYHDVYAVLASRPDDLETSYRAATGHVRRLVDRALATLAAGGEQTLAAARQHAQITGQQDVARIARSIARESLFTQRRLA